MNTVTLLADEHFSAVINVIFVNWLGSQMAREMGVGGHTEISAAENCTRFQENCARAGF